MVVRLKTNSFLLVDEGAVENVPYLVRAVVNDATEVPFESPDWLIMDLRIVIEPGRRGRWGAFGG